MVRRLPPFKDGPTTEGGKADYDDQGAYTPEGKTSKGGGPERIFWPTGKAPKGTYRYGVRWFQGTGSAKYTLKVYRGEGKVPETVKTDKLSEADRKDRVELGEVTVK